MSSGAESRPAADRQLGAGAFADFMRLAVYNRRSRAVLFLERRDNPQKFMSQPSTEEVLLERIRAGDRAALAEVYSRYRPQLKRMVQLRLDRRLQARLEPSDVLQEAYLDIAKRATE
jgi:hypothetical protein